MAADRGGGEDDLDGQAQDITGPERGAHLGVAADVPDGEGAVWRGCAREAEGLGAWDRGGATGERLADEGEVVGQRLLPADTGGADPSKTADPSPLHPGGRDLLPGS